MEAPLPAPGDEPLVEGNSGLRPCRAQKFGPAALFAVAVQSELGDDQDLAPHVLQPQVHLLVLVLEDAQARQLVAQLVAFGLGVVYAHPQQNEKALSDLSVHRAVNGDGGVLHPGQYRSHSVISLCCK